MVRFLYAFILSLILQTEFVYSQCENFEMTITTMNPTCYGLSDGSITVSQTGATGMVTGQVTDSGGFIMLNSGIGTCPNPLESGWYYIYLIDEAGCELYDSVYLEDPDEMEVVLDITLPSSVSSCDGIVIVDTVLHYVGLYDDIAYYWSGGPSGIGQTVKTDVCYGNNTLYVNNSAGCGVTVEFVVGNLSTDETTNSEEIVIYPNPFIESTTIQVEQSLIGEPLYIYNQLGILVRTTVINDQQTVINRDQLSAGFYFYRLENIQGILILE